MLASTMVVELLSPTPMPVMRPAKATAATRATAKPAQPPVAPSASPPVAETRSPAALTTRTTDQGAPQSISQPNCLINPPAYPPLSRQREETGTVLISIIIDTRGKIENAVIKQSSRFKRLDQAAREAALGSLCRPWLENGQPIRTTSDIPFIFKLEG
ncbi:energy transducer TonB [Mycoavidus sp. SF9855]|uniref:energy transducer TonB n=1 Tax=Mycoavidus sp. SF9855 TaxID=2968475 RepID=UPI00211C99C3|nr:energy transducer TonB [Mycoavidus sp. SF9855]UUM21184.1 energy transducer TonB [Mycoavidus sp. SF9855]